MEQMQQSVFGGGSVRAPTGGANVTLETDETGTVVLADLPGFERSEIDLRYEDGTLAIRAEQETNDEDGDGSVRTSRRRRVHEHVHVPGEVDEDDISASYRNGVLEVHLPAEADDGDDAYVIDIE